MATLAEALAESVQHLNAGRLREAEQVCRAILAAVPNQTDAMQVLGVVARRAGDNATAVQIFEQIVDLNDGNAAVHNNLGNALAALGRNDDAIAAYRRAVELHPGFVACHHALGNLLKKAGRLEEAVASLRRTVELEPGLAAAHNDLGGAYRAREQHDRAVACYRRAIELKPDLAEAHGNLGLALHDRGRFDEAIAAFEASLQCKPDRVETLLALGYAYTDAGRRDDAVRCYERMLALSPGYAAAHNALGLAWLDAGKLEDAAACFSRALAAEPNHFEATNNLGNTCRQQGMVVEALGHYRRALALSPTNATIHSNVLICLPYLAGTTPAELATAHAEYERVHAAPLQSGWRAHANNHHPDRRLRVGFASHDFVRHPVAMFLQPVLDHIDREACTTVCYNFRAKGDEVTAKLRAAAGQWRDVHALTDAELADTIREDKIDILFDLMGHTTGNRLPVFARKPAPIQITWAGDVATTGLAAMDFILADRLEIPPAMEGDYRERVLRMPHDYICYQPPDYAPNPAPLPARTLGFVTFGSFNNPAKLSPEILAAWGKILQRVPQSRLVLKYQGMDAPVVAGRLRQTFAAAGIDAGRLELLGGSPHPELLAAYRRLDLALDSFPYCGGLTTCETLWMGVPVLTCPGATFASRHSLTHCTNAGLTETIAGSPEEYVELAVSLAGDLPRLEQLRQGQRERMAASPLCDGKRFADDFASLLRGVWREWCGGAAP